MKVLPEVNKQVGGVISNAFFSKQILTKIILKNNLYHYLENFITFQVVYRLKGV